MSKIFFSVSKWCLLILALGTIQLHAQPDNLPVINDKALEIPVLKTALLFNGDIKVHVKINGAGSVYYAKSLSKEFYLDSVAENGARNAKFPKAALEGILIFSFKPVPEVGSVTQSVTRKIADGNASDGFYTLINDISQFSDVKESDPYFTDLKALVERHLAFGSSDNKFYAEKPLTRADLVFTFGKMMNYMTRFSGLYKLDFKRFRSPYNDRFFGKFPISEVHDLKSSDPYYNDVKNLAEYYQIYIYDETSLTKPSFTASKVLSHNEFRLLIYQIFGDQGLLFNNLNKIKLPQDDKPMTRGEFAIQTNQLIEYMKSVVTDAASDDY